jgi:hypothetical protein
VVGRHSLDRPHPERIVRRMPLLILFFALLLPLAVANCGEPSREEQAGKTLSQLNAEIRDARAELARINSEISDQQTRLTELKADVGKAETEAAKNTIAGEGTFVVGTDIRPGTYRAAAQEGCYWARLSSLDTSDIIDNDNANGLVVVQILPSDKAFTTNRCAEFHRVSG